MAAPDVIADASETLRAALAGALTGQAQVILHDLAAPTIAGDPPSVVTLGLWDIGEDPSVRNRPPVQVQVGDQWQIRAADLGLLQRYVVTAWAPDGANRLYTEQLLLGRVVEFFYRNAIISGPALAGTLAGTAQALGITMAPPSIEDRTRLWHGLVNRAVPVALYYEVRVVNMPIEVTTVAAAVTERRIAPKVAEVGP